MDWLPELVCCDGEWSVVVETLYDRFRADFVTSRPMFHGMWVRLPYAPLVENKHKVFWHLISEGEREDERIPDFRRCERIAWVRAVIEHADDPMIKVWRQNRREGNTAIALPDFSYIVFLGSRTPVGREPYMLLMTAYCVERQSKREKYQKEYAESCM